MLGVSTVRRAVRVLGARAAGPVGTAIESWGPDSGRSFTREQRALLRERTAARGGARVDRRADDGRGGSRDRVVSPKAQRALAGRIAGARLIELHGKGHLIPHHEPERLAEIVRSTSNPR